MISSLDVYLWGERVGTLVATKAGYREQILFYYDPEFLKGDRDIAPLRASIKSGAVANGFPVYPDDGKIFAGLPAFIADSLPDNWGAMVFREWAAKEGIRMRELTSLDRLAYIGRRGMGALEYLPPMAPKLETPFKVKIESLYELAEKTLSDSKNVHFSLTPDLQIENLFKVGTSAGGKRPKAILNINFDTGECYSGQVASPEEGFTPVIIKFAQLEPYPSARIEYSYYMMAKSAGLKMMDSRIMEIGGREHFITERFDRIGKEKLHVQTLAAMNPLATSYEELLEVAEKLSLPKGDKEQIFLLACMNVACGNVDDHSKNFSFIMDKTGRWQFAPAYDFTFTIDTSAPEYVNRQSLSINGKTSHISMADLLETARKYDIAGASKLIDKAVATAAAYEHFAAEAGVGDQWTAEIKTEITKREI